MAVIGVDMDGVLCREERAFDRPLATPIAGAREFLERARASGHTIVIYSARGWEQYKITVHWLNEHKMPFDQVILGKPVFDFFIDDRAIRFDAWGEAIEQLRGCGLDV